MDQHIPLILWCEKNRRGPSYMECVRDRIVPRFVEPLCEETLCGSKYNLQDLLQQDSKNEFFNAIRKSLPRRCICRDVEERAHKQMKASKDSHVSKIFKWMRLGNNKESEWRPSLDYRIRIFGETHEEAIEIAQRTPRSLAHALSEFVAVTIINCHAYCSVMREMMRFDDFWTNIRLLCDRVFRPSLCKTMEGESPNTLRAEKHWNKSRRPAPVRKGAATSLETFLKLLMTASNANNRPVKPTLLTAALSVNFQDDIESALEMMPGCTDDMKFLLHKIMHCVVPRKTCSLSSTKTLVPTKYSAWHPFCTRTSSPIPPSCYRFPSTFYRRRKMYQDLSNLPSVLLL